MDASVLTGCGASEASHVSDGVLVGNAESDLSMLAEIVRME